MDSSSLAANRIEIDGVLHQMNDDGSCSPVPTYDYSSLYEDTQSAPPESLPERRLEDVPITARDRADAASEEPEEVVEEATYEAAIMRIALLPDYQTKPERAQAMEDFEVSKGDLKEAVHSYRIEHSLDVSGKPKPKPKTKTNEIPLGTQQDIDEKANRVADENDHPGASEHLELLKVPCDGSYLCNTISDSLKLRTRLPNEALADMMALWVLASYNIEDFLNFGYINVEADKFGAGKSTVLETLYPFLRRAEYVFKINEASITRIRDANRRCTLIMDEADRWCKEATMQAVVNSMHVSNGCIPKQWVNPDTGKFETEKLYTYGPTVIAGVGQRPENVRQRSLTVIMKKMAANDISLENIDTLEPMDPTMIETRQKLLTWARDTALGESRQEINRYVGPTLGDQRFRKLWIPLYKTAIALGDRWVYRCEDAQKAYLTGTEDTETNLSLSFLKDMQALHRLLPDLQILHYASIQYLVSNADRIEGFDFSGRWVEELDGNKTTTQKSRILSGLIKKAGFTGEIPSLAECAIEINEKGKLVLDRTQQRHKSKGLPVNQIQRLIDIS